MTGNSRNRKTLNVENSTQWHENQADVDGENGKKLYRKLGDAGDSEDNENSGRPHKTVTYRRGSGG